MDNCKVTTLSNGVKIISEFIPYLKSFSLGFWFNIGARDENLRNNGISHFIEHMLFKGTKTRSAKQISDEIESYGGYLNAFTSKEQTCYYGRGLSENFKKTFVVLSDMIQNPSFKDSHIKKEAGVVIDELKDIDDNPEELIFDKFEESIFNGHSLSYPIIGTEKNILSYNSNILHQFHKANYRLDNLLISVSGAIHHEEAVALAEKYFKGKRSTSNQKRKTFVKQIVSEVFIEKEIQQVHSIIGRTTYGFNDPRRHKLKVLSTLLGDGSSSRLFQAVREKLGMTYQINTFLNSYLDVSAFGVYYSTNDKQAGKVNEIVHREFSKLRNIEVKPKELKRVKEYIKGNTLMSLESTTNRMIRLANSLLHYGKIVPIEDILVKIDSVTSEDIQKLSKEVLNESTLSKIIICSKDNSIKKAA
ncbi:MAG TPA: insulinase family protein [Ignavibacteriales bacterium]|nr:insulinase family protein [Ignavibacteriales bacterium]